MGDHYSEDGDNSFFMDFGSGLSVNSSSSGDGFFESSSYDMFKHDYNPQFVMESEEVIMLDVLKTAIEYVEMGYFGIEALLSKQKVDVRDNSSKNNNQLGKNVEELAVKQIEVFRGLHVEAVCKRFELSGDDKLLYHFEQVKGHVNDNWINYAQTKMNVLSEKCLFCIRKIDSKAFVLEISKRFVQMEKDVKERLKKHYKNCYLQYKTRNISKKKLLVLDGIMDTAECFKSFESQLYDQLAYEISLFEVNENGIRSEWFNGPVALEISYIDYKKGYYYCYYSVKLKEGFAWNDNHIDALINPVLFLRVGVAVEDFDLDTSMLFGELDYGFDVIENEEKKEMVKSLVDTKDKEILSDYYMVKTKSEYVF